MTYEQKNENLLNLLSRLADNPEYSEESRSADIQQLKEIYTDHYRHSYAEISIRIQYILQDDTNKGECLSQNLNLIKKSIETLSSNEKIPIEICDKVKKLFDHVNLEIGRYNLLVSKIDQKIKNEEGDNLSTINQIEFDKLKNKIKDVDEKVNKGMPTILTATEELGKIDDKLEKNNMSSITTLTVFSAVILAFTGSITFTSGVFSGMAKVSPYRIVFITSIVGLIVFNLIFMLLFIVGRMVGKNVSCRCQYATENEIHTCDTIHCGYGTRIPNLFCILIHKYPYILAINTIIICIMYYDLFLFFINHPAYIPFLYINKSIIFIGYLLPIILLFISIMFLLVKGKIMYFRNITNIKLLITNEYFHDEDDQSYSISEMLKALAKIKLMANSKKSDIESIVEKLKKTPDDGKRKKVFIKNLDLISQKKIFKQNYLLNQGISHKEHIYNKHLLDENINLILEDLHKHKN